MIQIAFAVLAFLALFYLLRMGRVTERATPMRYILLLFALMLAMQVLQFVALYDPHRFGAIMSGLQQSNTP